MPDRSALADALERDNHLLLPGALDPASTAALVACAHDRTRSGMLPCQPSLLPARQPLERPRAPDTGASADASDLAILHAWHARLGPLLECLSRDWAARSGGPATTPTALLPPVACFDWLEKGQHRMLKADPAATIDGSRLPFRFIALLARPGQDFEGGDLILTERRPRMQSRAFVVRLSRGDGAIVVCGQRWRIGTRGRYAVEVKRGVGPVRAGLRLSVELVFDRQQGHDRQQASDRRRPAR